MRPGDEVVLNALQYDVEVAENPFGAAASKLGVSEELLLRRARALFEAGVIRRFGFSVDYRAYGYTAALVGASPRGRPEEAVAALSRSWGVKHAFVREHPRYTVWFTARARRGDDVVERASKLASAVASDYVVLPTRTVCKLSVKYDLERGVSLAYRLAAEEVPGLWELGVDKRIVEGLERLPVSRRPFLEAAERLGETEKGLVDLAEELLGRGVFHDFGAVLDAGRAGFAENVVVAGEGGGDQCRAVAERVPEATHAVLRDVAVGEWSNRVFFVVHGRSRRLVDRVIGYAAEEAGIGGYALMYSVWGVTR